jgi:hypothetical protein
MARAPLNLDELRRLVQRKTALIRRLDARVEKEDAELCALEERLGALEDEEERKTTPPNEPD